MSAGVLVERSQIRDEMQKLAAGLVEEERRRGSAEERRQKVEGEVDALTASLFDQVSWIVCPFLGESGETEELIEPTRRIRWWLRSGWAGS